MRANKTIKGPDGEKRWNPKAVCPAYEMMCEKACLRKTCRGGTPDLDKTCLTFICVQCCRAVPYSFGAADRLPGCCDDCWAALSGHSEALVEPEPKLRFT